MDIQIIAFTSWKLCLNNKSSSWLLLKLYKFIFSLFRIDSKFSQGKINLIYLPLVDIIRQKKKIISNRVVSSSFSTVSQIKERIL